MCLHHPEKLVSAQLNDTDIEEHTGVLHAPQMARLSKGTETRPSDVPANDNTTKEKCIFEKVRIFDAEDLIL